MRAADIARIQIASYDARTASGRAPQEEGARQAPPGWFEMRALGARSDGQANVRPHPHPHPQRAATGSRFAAAVKLLAERVCRTVRSGMADVAALAGRIMSAGTGKARARRAISAGAPAAAAKARPAHPAGTPRQSRLLNLMQDPLNAKNVGEAIALLNLASGSGRPIVFHGMSYQQLQAFSHAAERSRGLRLSGAARMVLATNGHNRLVETLRAILDRHPALRNRGGKLLHPGDRQAAGRMQEMVDNAPFLWRSDLALKAAFLRPAAQDRLRSSAVPPSSGASPKTPPQTAAQAA